jgi:HSP20 family protein
MNSLPWRRSNGATALATDFEEPFRDFLEGFWRDVPSRLPATFRRSIHPAMNIVESPTLFTVQVELPGLDEKDIQIELMGNQLRIHGERKWEQEKKDKEFHRVESQFGSFERMVELPEGLRLEAESIQASYKKGVLEIRIPKIEPTPATKIAVKGG